MTPEDVLAQIPHDPVPLTWRQRFSLIARAALGTVDMKPGSLGHTILSRINLGGLGLPPRRGTPQMLQAYGEMPWLRAVSSRVGSSFASVEWRLYYAKKPGTAKAYRHHRAQKAAYADRLKIRKQLADEGELNEIESHPLLEALTSANEFHTGYQMRRITCIYVDLVGDAFWAKERNAVGMPIGFWPIPPSWILSTPTPQWPYFRVSYRGWQGMLPDADVLWFQDTDPLNPYSRGVGLATSLADELESDEYAARTTKQLFFNRARPDILVTAEGLNPQETARMEQDWVQKNQGFFRGFKPMFLNRKVDVHEFDTDFRSMQFVQLREFERNTIMQTWGVPPEILGVIENSNRSTIDASDYLYSSKVIVPRCEFFRGIFQERLIPEYDDRLIIDYESPVADDKVFIQQAMAAVPGAYRVDEHRELTGHAPLDNEEGQVFLVPALMTIKATLEESEPPPPPAPPGPPVPAPKPGGEEPAPAPPGKPEPSTEPAKAWHRGTAARRQLKGAYEDAANRIANRLEPSMRREFLAAVEHVRGQVDVEALARAVDRNDVHAAHAAIQVEHFANALQGARTVSRDAFQAGGFAAENLLADAGISMTFRMNAPGAAAWVMARGAALVTEISTTTREAIQQAILDAFSYGRPPRETAKSLIDLIGLTTQQASAVDTFRENLMRQDLAADVIDRRTSKYAAAQLKRRSQTIARTEIAAAQNGGQQEAWTQAKDAGLLDPDATKRIWIVTEDDRLDAKVCEPMEDQERGLDEPFVTGDGDAVMQPPAHPNCRCTVGLTVKAVEPTARTLRGLTDLRAELSARLEQVEGAITRPRKKTAVRDNGRIVAVVEE